MIPTSARRRIVIKMLIDYSTGQVAPRRRIEKKTTSQSSAKALLILQVQSDLAPVYCPSINRNNPEGETDKQTNKQAEVACAEVQMQGVVQSCIACKVRYAMHQSTQKSFRDASEMHQKSAESNAQGHTLTSYPCLTPILMLVFEFQNAGFKHEHQTQMFNPWNEDLKLPDLKMSDSHIQPMELQLQTVGLPHTTHGTSTSNCRTPTYNPWNFNFKLSDSHIQPMELQLQTVGLPHTTHGTSTSNCLTPMFNPWNEGLKPSDSHIQPME